MVPPVIVPAATPSAPYQSKVVMAPNSSPMTIAVIVARSRMRRLAVAKLASTALVKRSASRVSCPKAWTIFMAPSCSAVVAPMSATRSWLERETFCRRRPSSTIGMMMTGIPSRIPPVSFGESEKR